MVFVCPKIEFFFREKLFVRESVKKFQMGHLRVIKLSLSYHTLASTLEVNQSFKQRNFLHHLWTISRRKFDPPKLSQPKDSANIKQEMRKSFAFSRFDKNEKNLLMKFWVFSSSYTHLTSAHTYASRHWVSFQG